MDLRGLRAASVERVGQSLSRVPGSARKRKGATVREYITLTRDTDDDETAMITHYYVWLAFTTSLNFQEDRRFLWLKHYLQSAGLYK